MTTATAAPVAATDGSPVNAPLAGTVVKVLVKPGQAVAEGETIIILEAMKMENSIKSPGDGLVKAVNVSLKQSVEKNQVLIQF